METAQALLSAFSEQHAALTTCNPVKERKSPWISMSHFFSLTNQCQQLFDRQWVLPVSGINLARLTGQQAQGQPCPHCHE